MAEWERVFAREKALESRVWRIDGRRLPADTRVGWKVKFYGSAAMPSLGRALKEAGKGQVIMVLPGEHVVDFIWTNHVPGLVIEGVHYNEAVVPTLLRQCLGTARSLDAVAFPPMQPNVRIVARWEWTFEAEALIRNVHISCNSLKRRFAAICVKNALKMKNVTVDCVCLAAVWCAPRSRLEAEGCFFRCTTLAHALFVMQGASAALRECQLVQSSGSGVGIYGGSLSAHSCLFAGNAHNGIGVTEDDHDEEEVDDDDDDEGSDDDDGDEDDDDDDAPPNTSAKRPRPPPPQKKAASLSLVDCVFLENKCNGLDIRAVVDMPVFRGNKFLRNGLYGLSLRVALDAEVAAANLIGDNGLGDVQLLKPMTHAAAIGEALRRNVCTVVTLGTHDALQQGFSCYDCEITGNLTMCEVCARKHEEAGHHVEEDEMVPLFCDCFFAKCDVCPHSINSL